MPQFCVHGGDIYNHNIRLDFSVNINPLDIGEEIRAGILRGASSYGVYPEAGNGRLREAIGKSEGLGRNQVLCGNGASELLAAVMHAFEPKHVLIPQPAFAGYTWAAGMVNAAVENYVLKETDGFAITEEFLEALTEDVDILILANPSNPVGRLTAPKLLSQILLRCQQKNILVLLDECFIEFTGQESAVRLLSSFDNLVILRAFTKIYGMPGVRLGYLFASVDFCSRIARQLPEWNLSVLAQETGLAVMGTPSGKWDRKQFIEETRLIIDSEKEKIYQELTKMESGDFVIYPSKANFLLLRTKLPLYDKLLEKGILIRDCSNYPGLDPGYYRIAVRGPEENQKLLQAVSDLYRS